MWVISRVIRWCTRCQRPLPIGSSNSPFPGVRFTLRNCGRGTLRHRRVFGRGPGFQPCPARVRWGATAGAWATPVGWIVMFHGKTSYPLDPLQAKAFSGKSARLFHGNERMGPALPSLLKRHNRAYVFKDIGVTRGRPMPSRAKCRSMSCSAC